MLHSKSPAETKTAKAETELNQDHNTPSLRTRLAAGHKVFFWDPTRVAGSYDAKVFATVVEVHPEEERENHVYPFRLDTFNYPEHSMQVIEPYKSEGFIALEDFDLFVGKIDVPTFVDKAAQNFNSSAKKVRKAVRDAGLDPDSLVLADLCTSTPKRRKKRGGKSKPAFNRQNAEVIEIN